MPNRIIAKSPGPCRNRSWLAAGLATVVLLWPAAGMSATEGPFRPFLGNWRGAGDIVASDGHREQVMCRARYLLGESVATLTQSLVCASDSYRFDVESSFVANGENLQGQWQETTRNVAGNLMGHIGNGDFEGTVTGANFTAQISVKSDRVRQVVLIRPSAGDISSMEVTLQRQH